MGGGVACGGAARSRGSLDEEIAASAPLRFLPGFQDSPRCHEATIIFNLLRLLTWDLKLAALSGPYLAVCCALVLMLMTTVLTSTGAVPVTTPLATLLGARGCDMAQFKSLPPQEMEAFRRAKDALEESLLLRNRSCSSRPLPRTRDLRQLQVWERPVALEAELALTLKVLGTVANSTLGDILDQRLHTLRYIHSKLQACVSALGSQATSVGSDHPYVPVCETLFTHHPPSPTGPSSVHSRPQARGHLCQWLHCLQETRKKESHGYLKASVTFNLFHHLTHDLKYVSGGDLCV
ncbi:Interleukin-28B [Myotis davidii]|uniref:Interleukin-28B n=1 Tax=Myotis davidii TaxID=225400 RepID=L5ME92_MYODS|nr:Interleukin-28B [Myotis davidii]